MKPEIKLFDADQIRRIIRLETETHPGFELIDLFKLLYQAYLGPHHMIPDRTAIIRNIEMEIAASKQPYLPALQDIGAGEGFYRVSLSSLELFKDEHPVEILADLILDSRFDVDPPSGFFRGVWSDLLPIIGASVELDPDALRSIDSLLRDERLPSHSVRYKNAHHPSYRLVHHSVLSYYLEREYPTIEF
ncbi:MAG: hypothetical protein U1B83_01480 [Candidatus Cloacimonadaceae bacterium]|nr:hypothetical protein [Candidatus Cloacimonadaceae bacterium]